jgi:predicted metal-dependent phosphotriesterase family hydrolase
MEDKEKSEIEIINEKVSLALEVFENDKTLKEKAVKALKKNQNNFYNWQQIEKGIDSYINTDEQLLNYMNKNFGEGILKAVIKKFIPSLKKDLSNIIDSQIKIVSDEKAKV